MSESETCPYCGAPVEFKPSSYIYDWAYNNGYVFICTRYPKCDAYVGCHGTSKNPLGTLADSGLRARRRDAHFLFDQLWEKGAGRKSRMSRTQAYQALAEALGLPIQDTHIGQFDRRRCQQVIEFALGELHADRKCADHC